MNYTVARENLAAAMDQVCSDHAPLIITRDDNQAVVMVSLEDYESMEETNYLMSSAANAKRLLEAIQALESGQGVARNINLDL